MRIELQHNHAVLCGGVLPPSSVKVGQKWISSGGYVVEVENVQNGWVFYKWDLSDGRVGRHDKDEFSFQCRYCLIVTGIELNDWIQAIPQA